MTLGFLIAEYQFIEPGATGCADYPYRFNHPCVLFASWPQVDTTDLPGLPGQDEPNPASAFGRHFILKLGDKYFDPSYGGDEIVGDQAAAETAWQARSVAGFYATATNKFPPSLGARRSNPNDNEIRFDSLVTFGPP